MTVLGIPLDHGQVSGQQTKMYDQGKEYTCISKWLNEDILHGEIEGSAKDGSVLKSYSRVSYKPWQPGNDLSQLELGLLHQFDWIHVHYSVGETVGDYVYSNSFLSVVQYDTKGTGIWLCTCTDKLGEIRQPGSKKKG